MDNYSNFLYQNLYQNLKSNQQTSVNQQNSTQNLNNSQTTSSNLVNNLNQNLNNLATNLTDSLINSLLSDKTIIEKQQQILDSTLTKMNSEDLAKYLQKAMELPKTIEETLNQLLANSQMSQKQAGILDNFLESLISVRAIDQFVLKNSTNAINKLLQSISNAMKSQGDTKELKQILNLLTSIQSSVQNSDSIKDILLLYIPITPFVFNQEINFRKLTSKESLDIENSFLSLMFQTINFKNILCCLNEDENGIYTTIYIEKTFPYETLEKLVDLLAKKSFIKTFFEEKIIENSQEEITQKQNLKVISKGSVPLDILLLSHIITQVIFKIDNEFQAI